MLTNNEIKFVKSLYLKKNRDKFSLFIAEGEKIVSELIKSNFIVKKIYALNDWFDNNQISSDSEQYFQINSKELSRISRLKAPNKVLAIVEKKINTIDINKLSGLTLILDNISDPGNLGTIIRSCHWFNVKNIICSENTVDIYNSKVIQSSMGSIFYVNVLYTDLFNFFNELDDRYKVYGSFLDGIACKKVKIDGDYFLIIGNESNGISESICKFVDKKITIKKFTKNIDSLNAATATSILLHEFTK